MTFFIALRRAHPAAAVLLLLMCGRASSGPAASLGAPSWRSWGAAAFDEAKSTRRPLLVFIEASWDHWCHRMDREVYSDSVIVALIGERYVPVRVDRDIFPDVDRRYNTGGWPSTLILTPDGDVVRADGYVDARSFAPILLQASQYWRQNTTKILTDKAGEREKRHAALRTARGKAPGAATGIPEWEILRATANSLLGGAADTLRGGIGAEPRFPAPSTLRFALLASRELGDPRLSRFVRTSLDSMRAGGIYDRLGGGFHRYSRGSGWNDPAYEKLLTVNAELLEVYLAAFEESGDSTCLAVARETGQLLLDRFYDPDRRLFALAEDADDYRGEFGGVYRWTADDLRAALHPPAIRYALTRFGFDRLSGAKDAALPLCLAVPTSEAARRSGVESGDAGTVEADILQTLRNARARRPAPRVIPLAAVDGNAAAAIACLHLARTSPADSALADVAREVIASLRRGGCDPNAAVPHVIGVGKESPRLLRDQVLFTRSLLELHLDGGDPAALDDAVTAARTLVERFTDPENGALVDRIALPDDVPEMSFPIQDGEQNGLAAEVLLDTAEISGAPDLREAAARVVAAWLPRYRDSGYFAGYLGLIARRLHRDALLVMVAAPGISAEARAFRAAAGRACTGWTLWSFTDTRRYPETAKRWGLEAASHPTARIFAGRRVFADANSTDELREALRWMEEASRPAAAIQIPPRDSAH